MIIRLRCLMDSGVCFLKNSLYNDYPDYAVFEDSSV